MTAFVEETGPVKVKTSTTCCQLFNPVESLHLKRWFPCHFLPVTRKMVNRNNREERIKDPKRKKEIANHRSRLQGHSCNAFLSSFRTIPCGSAETGIEPNQTYLAICHRTPLEFSSLCRLMSGTYLWKLQRNCIAWKRQALMDLICRMTVVTTGLGG
jgi:hypothetical protein